MTQIFDKLTINHNLHTKVLIQKWPINTISAEKEPQRVDVEVDDRRCYSLVLDENPRIEIWDLNSEGELNNLQFSYDLPRI